jgi:hypothetical protein
MPALDVNQPGQRIQDYLFLGRCLYTTAHDFTFVGDYVSTLNNIK